MPKPNILQKHELWVLSVGMIAERFRFYLAQIAPTPYSSDRGSPDFREFRFYPILLVQRQLDGFPDKCIGFIERHRHHNAAKVRNKL